jgi:ferritin-like metal-binding protein YciE
MSDAARIASGAPYVMCVYPSDFPDKTCAAIVGITDEGAEIMEEYKGSPALDAGLLAAAQAVEHYEISRYGTLKAWAEELGFDDAVELLEETLEEEEATDEALTEIAKSAINQQAEAAE